jgi:hypothetical protein
VASALHAISTPYSTSVSVPLYAIIARSITNQRTSSGVGIGFTFLPHVIIPDKRYGVHCCHAVVSLTVTTRFQPVATVVEIELESISRRHWCNCRELSWTVASVWGQDFSSCFHLVVNTTADDSYNMFATATIIWKPGFNNSKLFVFQKIA